MSDTKIGRFRGTCESIYSSEKEMGKIKICQKGRTPNIQCRVCGEKI